MTMKPLLIATLSSFLIGGAIGYSVPSLFQQPSNTVPEPEVPLIVNEGEAENAELIEENEALKERVEGLKMELANEAMATEAWEPSEADVRKLRKQWITNALEKAVGNRKHKDREISRAMQQLGLTLEQGKELGSLIDKRDLQRRLEMMKNMGLISEEEYQTMFVELETFDFKFAFNNILSDEQQETYDSIQNDRKVQSVERMTQAVSDRLNLSDSDRYSETERSSINEAMKSAFDRDNKIEVPPAIQQLDVNGVDKRILAAGYENLDAETFQKLYESVVEKNNSGGNRRGGNRNRRNP